jgi:hypothetical protein
MRDLLGAAAAVCITVVVAWGTAMFIEYVLIPFFRWLFMY